MSRDEFKKTDIQKKAIKKLAGQAKYICLFGGSRSGKSFIICYSLIVRACKVKSRHIILRLNFNHCKRTIWLQTLPSVLSLAFPNLPVQWNRTDYYLTLPNGSEIWIGGLDTKERTEKILGAEFSSCFFNECSQLDYASVQIALTRLAEKNDLKKRVFYDMNPPTKKHWSYWLFIRKTDPTTKELLKNPDDYASLLMNPQDNLENIDDDYIQMLESLSEKERQRFLMGEFTDVEEGLAYYSFEETIHVHKQPELTPDAPLIMAFDFNVNPTTLLLIQKENGILRFKKEFSQKNSSTPNTVRSFCEQHPEFKNTPIKIRGDASGKNRNSQTGRTDYFFIEDVLRTYGFNNLIFEVLGKNPPIVDRVARFNSYLKNGAGQHKIEIDPTCKELIGDLSSQELKGRIPSDAGNIGHKADAAGYAVYWDHLTSESSEQRTIDL